MTPTALTLRLLRQWQYLPAVVERWVQLPDGKNIRRDCYGGFDVLAVDPRGKTTWLVQCTTLSNLSARIKKLRGLPDMPKLIAGGVICEAWGWHRQGECWAVKRLRLLGDDLEPVLMTQKRTRRRLTVQSGLFDTTETRGIINV